MLPSKDREYLQKRGIVFETKVEGASRGLILKDFVLPTGKYDVVAANILILLPSGYPDASPDCFYTLPRVRFAQTRQDPKATAGNYQFDGHKWQFWSRHNSEWRPNVDGIWTMLKRIEYALEVAT